MGYEIEMCVEQDADYWYCNTVFGVYVDALNAAGLMARALGLRKRGNKLEWYKRVNNEWLDYPYVRIIKKI